MTPPGPAALLLATQNLNAVLRIMQWGVIALIFIFFLRDNIVILGGLKQAQVTSLVVIALTLPVIAYLLRNERLAAPPEKRPTEAASTAGEVAG